MRNQIILYMHAGSGNHGCEAIAGSLCRMIHTKAALISNDAQEDEKYSLSGLCEIIQERKFSEHRLMHLLYYIYRKLSGDKESFIRFRYRAAFGRGRSPLAISIGGDNYCYDNMLNDLALANRAFHRAGTKTVLLGCSIEPERLRQEALYQDLKRYSVIIARESITYEALQTAFGVNPGNDLSPALLLCPDPAFTLPKKTVTLPAGFISGNTVGINISPMIIENEEEKGITLAAYKALMQYIIDTTDMQIALIPHVVWARNDDRIPIQALYEQFKESSRVVMIEDGDCETLKGYISHLKMFIGARTHATIAAYSTMVPTLVVGYSVKALGIARDLFGTHEDYVIPVQQLKQKEDLIQAFDWLCGNETAIRQKLMEVIPAYCERALQTGKEVDRLWEELTLPPKM